MRHNPAFELDDVDAIKQLIRDYPFVTVVSATTRGMVASHYPVLFDEDQAGIVLLGHVGRPDDELHELGQHEVLVIAQGRHGYVSPSWYPDRATVPAVPTWNFTAAHLYGEVEVLSEAENYRVLDRLVTHFEQHVEHPRPMEGTEIDAASARKLQHGTRGFRIRITRIDAKSKLSQNKTADTVGAVVDALDGDGPYANADLATDMKRARDGRP